MVVKYKVQQTAGLLQHERVINQVAEFDAGALPIRGATSKRIAAAARIPTSAGCGIRAKNALVQIKMSVLEPVQRVAGAAVIPEHGGKRPYSRCSQHTNWLCGNGGSASKPPGFIAFG